VFFDDIDWLEPDQIWMLLRQVKANANLPNIVCSPVPAQYRRACAGSTGQSGRPDLLRENRAGELRVAGDAGVDGSSTI
jgi:hypothetical protein